MFYARLIILFIFILTINIKANLLAIFIDDQIEVDKNLKGKAPVLLMNYVKNFKVKEKQQVKLKCPIDMILSQNTYPSDDDYDYNNNLIIINWYDNHNTKIVSPFFNNKRFIIENDVHLIIKNVDKASDEGTYTCSANNGFGTISVNLTLIVIDELVNEAVSRTPSTTRLQSTSTLNGPIFVDKVLNETKVVRKIKGDDLKLHCDVKKSSIKTDILWYKNDEVLNEEDYGITRSKWSLNLKNLTPQDSGKYTCYVSNKNGFINATYEVEIYDDTEIFQGMDPLNSTIEIGESTVFTCKVKIDLAKTILWLKQITRNEYDNYVSEEFESSSFQEQNKLSSFINSFFPNNFKSTEKKKKNEFEYLDGTHYITIKDEMLNQEKFTLNDVYINKLTVKNATNENSGYYMCLAVTSNGYTFRKAHLNVKSPNTLFEKTFNSYSIKMSNLLIIIAPLIMIIVLSTVLIICIKCINTDHEDKICAKILSKFFTKKHQNPPIYKTNGRTSTYLPVFNSAPARNKINSDRNINEYMHPKEDNGDDSKIKFSSTASTSVYLSPNNTDPSTTITTLLSTSDSLSNLPSSVIYYKVIDCNQNRLQNSVKQKDDLTSVISATNNSCFYYQLNSDNDVKS